MRKLPPATRLRVTADAVAISSLFTTETQRHRDYECFLFGSVSLWLPKMFQNTSSAHASTDAHGHYAVASVTAFQLADDGRRELGAGAAQRMPKRDCATIRIDALQR